VNQDLSVKVLKATDMGREGEFLLSFHVVKVSGKGREGAMGGRGWEHIGENVG
jgi:hypothetical protein